MGTLQEEIPIGWHINGQLYDLTNFLDKHPGGKEILLVVKGKEDSTSMFETYHSFADFDYISNKIQEFKIGKSPVKPLLTFKENEFYCIVRKRVKNFFGNEKSVTNKVEKNINYIIKIKFKFKR